MADTSVSNPGRRRELGQMFQQGGANYESLRPGYPSELAAWLVGAPPPVDVVDVGAGTGKLTRQLVALGCRVRAVDPSADMLAQLAAALPQVSTFIGTGEQVPLPDHCADAVTYAQAWHWVDPVIAAREARRLLRPGGRLGVVWNVIDESIEWQAALVQVMRHAPSDSFVEQMNHSPSFPAEFGPVQTLQVPWRYRLTKRGLAELVTTRSYYLELDESARRRLAGEVSAQVEATFPTLGAGDPVDLTYVANGYRAMPA